MEFQRSGGILLHPTSLPGSYGIGDLGAQAATSSMLPDARRKLWQVLPLGPTGYGDSPYQCFSAFAGNPLLDQPRSGRRRPADAAGPGASRRRFPDAVDYGAVIP